MAGHLADVQLAAIPPLPNVPTDAAGDGHVKVNAAPTAGVAADAPQQQTQSRSTVTTEAPQAWATRPPRAYRERAQASAGAGKQPTVGSGKEPANAGGAGHDGADLRRSVWSANHRHR